MRFFAGAVGDGTCEAQFAREDFAGEVAFADEVRDDVDEVALDGVEDLTHGGLFFPEGADDFCKEAAAANFIRVLMRGRAGVRVHGGTVTDEDESGTLGGWKHRGG